MENPNNDSGVNLDINLPSGNSGASDTDANAPSTNDVMTPNP